MKKIAILIISCIALSGLVSCEHIIDFDNDHMQTDGITINALAVADTDFVAIISKAEIFNKLPPQLDDLPMWVLEKMPDPYFFESSLLKDAKVQMVVNGENVYNMNFDDSTNLYRGDYIPQIDDEVELVASWKDAEDAKVKTTIPPTVKIDVLGYEKYYQKKEITDEMLSEIAADTMARITLRIHDPGNENNFYRLKVRSANEEINPDGKMFYSFSDIYSSTDIIFKDEQLNKSYRGWQAYFSNVFDDHLFNGKEYTFSVESRLRLGNTPYAIIELQSITRELYYYLKSVMYYRITDIDAYSEGVHIYSNVDNGFGILGGVSSDKHIIHF